MINYCKCYKVLIDPNDFILKVGHKTIMNRLIIRILFKDRFCMITSTLYFCSLLLKTTVDKTVHLNDILINHYKTSFPKCLFISVSGML